LFPVDTNAPGLVASAVSLEFESDLRSIYSRSRTADEISREIAALRDKIAARREACEKEYERTSQIIESRFDQDVRRVFRRLRDELPEGLVQLARACSRSRSACANQSRERFGIWQCTRGN